MNIFKSVFCAVCVPSAFMLNPSAADAQSPVLPGAAVEKIADGFQFTEGPVWKDGEGLYFSDIDGNTVYLWSEQLGAKPFLQPSGKANGLAFDSRGRLLLAQQGARRVIRLEPDGSQTVLAERYAGKRLNSPNDIAVASDGSIFFTDPPYGISQGQAELGFSGIYRIDPSGNLQLLDKTLSRPNGIVFSPDGQRLYVADSEARVVYVWDVLSESALANKKPFASIKPLGYADGMKVDSSGNVYSTGPLGVWVFSPDGAVLDTILVPGQTTNCNWGDWDRKTLYITSGTAVYRVRVGATRVHPSKRKAGAFRKPELHSNHPNPFNPTTTIGYTMAEGGYASLKIMDVYGREVSTLVQGYLQPGTHTSEFNAANLAAGVYVYGLKAGGGFSARKMVLLK